MTNLEVGDVVMCTVERIEGAVVFVKIDGDGQGGIVLSEIAPGRIRNLRDYVVPKKKIVCKVLRISGDRVDLSLRRVTQKEKKEILEKESQERSYKNILKTTLGKLADPIIAKITEKETLYDFLERAKDSPELLENFVDKKTAEKVLEILNKQRERTFTLKKDFSLTTTKSDGITLIKNTLGNLKGMEIKYLSAGKYSIKTEAKDLKKADTALRGALSEIEKNAKTSGLEFSIK